MILQTEKLQKVCKSLLEAVDTSSDQAVSETLELHGLGRELYLSVTNREYFVSIRLELDNDIEEFLAVVDATLFLNLIAKITTKEANLTVKDNVLVIKANGNYKLPMIYDKDGLVELPRITLGEVTTQFTINSDNLISMLTFNSKELTKETFGSIVQKMYYLDQEGALTFTGCSACVNDFKLDKPLAIVLNAKVVKLFKLFDENCEVSFSLSYDSDGTNILPKASFETKDTTLTAILSPNTNLINQVPVKAIRGIAKGEYPYSTVLERTELIEAINRLMLFSKKHLDNNVAKMVFTKDSLTISDIDGENNEVLKYSNIELPIDNQWSCYINLKDLKLTLEGCSDLYITMLFGDNSAIVISRKNIWNVISLVRVAR